MMRRFLLFLRSLFRKGRLESELNEELNFHLAMQMEQNLEKGMDVEEAKRQAILSLGGPEQIKESCRDVRPAAFFDTLIQDIRYAIRSLRRSPGFLSIVVLTLTLGIGANTAIFTVLRAVLFRPLPYPDAERLVMIWMREKDGSISNTNYATYIDWKERLHSFQAIAVMSAWEPTLHGYGEPTPLEGLSVTHEFLSALGIRPYLGRDFLSEEDRPDHNRVVLLTHRFWKRRLGGDPAIVGKQINLSGIPRTVVGVLPPYFESIIRYDFKEAEIFRPLGYDRSFPPACRSCNHLTAIGRIRQDVPFTQAAQEIDSFTRALIERYPQDYGNAGATIVTLHEQVVSKVKNVMVLLFAGVGVVLLIACSNVASLMLARATRRSQEIAIRAALGASRKRIVRQLLTESALLAFAGGTLGVLLSTQATGLLVRHAPAGIPRLQNVSMDLQVLLFAVAATFVCALIFGLIPAWKSSRLQLLANLQASSRSVSADRQNLRKGLVVANIALAFVLLTAAALLFDTISNLLSQQLGFKKENVITMMIGLSGPQFDDHAKVDLYYQQVLERVCALPGIKSAGVVSQLPLSTNVDMYGIEVRDKPLAHRGEAPSAERFAITPGYLTALRIPALQGRGITAEDHAQSMPVVLVNRTFAEKTWGKENPIGKQIHIGERERPWRTVVGVVEDVRHRGLQEPFAMQFYMPLQQWFDTSMTLVARTAMDPNAQIASIRKAIWSVDRKQPISQIATMEDVVEATVAQKRFTLRLIGFFAVTALFLAVIGVYGVMAYSVTARFHEIGIRMALGADRPAVLSLILRNGVFLTLCGICIGVAGSLLLMRFLKTLLFGVQPSDPWVQSVVVLIIFAVAFLACFVPAVRAARLNPLLALRNE